MRRFQSIFQRLILQDYRQARANWSSQASDQEIVDAINRFKQIQNGLPVDKRAIEAWQDGPFQAFKAFIDSYQSRRAAKAERGQRGNQVGFAEFVEDPTIASFGYDLIFIPTYQACQFYGRQFRAKSTKWCISTSNPFFFHDIHGTEMFFFLVRDPSKPSSIPGADTMKFAKIALQMVNRHGSVDVVYWNLQNQDSNTNGRAQFYSSFRELDRYIKSIARDLHARFSRANEAWKPTSQFLSEKRTGIWLIDMDRRTIQQMVSKFTRVLKSLDLSGQTAGLGGEGQLKIILKSENRVLKQILKEFDISQSGQLIWTGTNEPIRVRGQNGAQREMTRRQRKLWLYVALYFLDQSNADDLAKLYQMAKAVGDEQTRAELQAKIRDLYDSEQEFMVEDEHDWILQQDQMSDLGWLQDDGDDDD